MFLIPLEDATYSVGQVLLKTVSALNSVICAFSKIRTDNVETATTFTPRDVVAVLFTTPDLLNSGDWRVIRHEPEIVPVARYIDMHSLEAKGYVGVKIIGSGIVENLLNAWFGLEPWDAFYEPDYLDKLLLPSVTRPDSAVLSDDAAD